jgi:hypothetical protein
MGVSGAATAPECGERSRRARLRGLLRAAGGRDEATSDGHAEELEQEIALLREENARLKLAREHAEDRPLNERLRAALAAAGNGGETDSDGEEPWEVLTECMLLRETMLDACRELERGAAELRTRLETLLNDGSPERPSSDLERVT